MKTEGNVIGMIAMLLPLVIAATPMQPIDTSAQKDARMKWWREARFGLFIHWGLYAVPAGKWGNHTGYGEWIRESAQIPVDEYERFLTQFNPVKFDADRWVAMAKNAGMQYIVVTSKHHDGFNLFDSKHTDWDVMSTPFKRDIMKELSQASARGGIKQCWYHSIMDWHHPDYLPRRTWEVGTRPAGGADMNRFVEYLHNEVTQLLTDYGPIGVMWFDGEWESTWNHEYGKALYDLCRKVQPNVIVNNRVDVGRGGMMGMTTEGDRAGDYGTPEQEIPPTGMAGVDWETCMTMNDHWGYNAWDKNFKSSRQLIRMLCDIASKGGNFLLNVGPTAEGEFPPESVERMKDIGKWMAINGDAIQGTNAGPFKTLAWGRCTVRRNTLYLHVFDWPKDGKLTVPGLGNTIRRAYLMAGRNKDLKSERAETDVWVSLPAKAPDEDCSVVALELDGSPVVYAMPEIKAPATMIIKPMKVEIDAGSPGIIVRYTTDGSTPDRSSPSYNGPVTVSPGDFLKARSYYKGKPVSGVAKAVFVRATAWPAIASKASAPGLLCEAYEGDWNKLPNFKSIEPKWSLESKTLTFTRAMRREYFGLRYSGYLSVTEDDVYRFALSSDDGSRLLIDGNVVVDNDGLHSMASKDGFAPLAAGKHRVVIEWFNKTGGAELTLEWSPLGQALAPIPASALSH